MTKDNKRKLELISRKIDLMGDPGAMSIDQRGEYLKLRRMQTKLGSHPIDDGIEPFDWGNPDHRTGVYRGAFQAPTLGWGDGIEAGVRSVLPGGGSWREEVDQLRGEQNRFEDDYPGMALGAEILASVPTGFASALAKQAIRGGKKLTDYATKKSITQHAIGAGKFGGAYGAGKSVTDPQDPYVKRAFDLLGDTAEGAATGFLMTYPLVAAPRVVKNTVLWAGKRLRGQSAGELNATKARDSAIELLRDSLHSGQFTPDEVARYLNNPESLVAEMGRGTRVLSAWAMRGSGRAQDKAESYLTDRAAGEGERIGSFIRDKIFRLKGALSLEDEITAIMKRRGSNGTKDYNRAFYVDGRGGTQVMVKITPETRNLLSQPNMKKIIRKAEEQIKDDINRPDSVSPLEWASKHKLNWDQGWPMDKDPELSVQSLDFMKRVIDDALYKSNGMVKAIQGAERVSLKKARNKIIKLAENATGGKDGAYATARRRWATDTELMRLADLGADYAKHKNIPSQAVLGRRISKLSAEGKEVVRHGFVNEIISKLERSSNVLNPTASTRLSRAQTRVIKALSPDPEKDAKLLNEMIRIERDRRMLAAKHGNSITSLNQILNEQFSRAAGLAHTLGELAFSWKFALARMGARATGEMNKRAAELIKGEVVELMLNPKNKDRVINAARQKGWGRIADNLVSPLRDRVVGVTSPSLSEVPLGIPGRGAEKAVQGVGGLLHPADPFTKREKYDPQGILGRR